MGDVQDDWGNVQKSSQTEKVKRASGNKPLRKEKTKARWSSWCSSGYLELTYRERNGLALLLLLKGEPGLKGTNFVLAGPAQWLEQQPED